MGRRALRQGGGDGGAQLRHVNTRRTEEPADREGFIFPEHPRDKKQGSENTHYSFRPERATGPLDVRHNHSITTLLHYSITHTTVYRYREEEESRG